MLTDDKKQVFISILSNNTFG